MQNLHDFLNVLVPLTTAFVDKNNKDNKFDHIICETLCSSDRILCNRLKH